MIIAQYMLPKTLLQGSLGDLSSQMWLLTSFGYVLVMVISQGETARAQTVPRVATNGTSNLVLRKVIPKISEMVSDWARIVSSEALVIEG